ncbi:MAG: AIM24 family protein [Candidatus Eremiobacteraeota bacterium]|nr:AIM24 family protein [Candidatus Eremiobacteraeota bacterium]
MRVVPRLKPTGVRDESYGGVTYHIEGELVPVLHVELGRDPIYFEHHVLLWKNASVDIGLKSLAGGFKRLIAGLPIFMTEARGPGHIGFSRDGAGQVFALHLERGQSVDVREHQFLAATDGVDYSFTRVKGISNMFFGGSGFFIDTFACPSREGVLWLHGFGNVFEIELEAGQQFDIEPGGWIYKDPSVSMETQFQRFTSGFFASAGQIFWNRFTGPGRIAIQSMYMHLPEGADQGRTSGGGLGGVIGSLLDN